MAHVPSITVPVTTQVVPPAPLTDAFNLMAGLVIDYYGQPAIITNVTRDMDNETIHVEVNTTQGDFSLPMSWGYPNMVRVIGLAVNCEPDNIDLFTS